ncbi:MAG: hypothetical protein U9R75_08005 [Candidatus Thermoplasmatota archaeon]|nr:hypothetical protein [Candidatus Thermoplasmatota archaeon]
MARFKEERALNADPVHVKNLLQKAAGELDLILDQDSRGSIRLKEKYRFDHFNQVEMDIEMEGSGSECRILVDGQNQGISDLQHRHVRSKVLELLSRVQIDLEYMEPIPADSSDPVIARELDLLSDLHGKKILTDHEYSQAKSKLLES